MPKRKATGPAESDGEEDDYYSYPSATSQSSSPKMNSFVPPASTSLTSMAFSFGGGGGGGGGGGAAAPNAKRSVPNKSPFTVGLNKSPVSTGTLTSGEPAIKSGSLGAGNQEFAKSMRDLNLAFHHSVRKVVTKNPSHSLIPLVKDYLFHSRVLLEQFKKGGSQTAGMNGIDLPLKTFKSLGEFFDDFETRYVENNQGDGAGNSQGSALQDNANSALISNSLPSSPETSKRSNFNSTFVSSMSSPKPADNTKRGESSPPEPPSVKFNSIQTSNLVTATTTTTFSGFLAQGIPAVPNPLKPASSSPTASTSAAAPKPSSGNPTTSVPKPGFAGFSFLPSLTPFTPAPGATSSSSSASTTFAKAAPDTTSEAQNNDEGDEEEDQPPKVEITQVKEDDAVYSIRCKVFGVVDGKCKDKGIGMLYVKKLEDGRHQIVVRADNNLGTVILNILLQNSLPLSKNGKNNIATVDLAANDKKGMPIFIRVKTEADADELLAKLKEFQKAS